MQAASGWADLIRYGSVDAARHANAPQSRYRPGPVETTIPSGTPGPGMMNLFTSADFSTIAVHIAAAIRSMTAPRTEKMAERRKVYVRVHKPLKLGQRVQSPESIGETRTEGRQARQ
jgi:hypothetical protein